MYYGKPDAYTKVRRSAVALNGSFFHTQRMVLQYLRNAYLGVEPELVQLKARVSQESEPDRSMCAKIAIHGFRVGLDGWLRAQ